MAVSLISAAARAARSLTKRLPGNRSIGRGGQPQQPGPPLPQPVVDVQDALNKFERGMQKYILVTNSSLPDVLNRRMLFLSFRAQKDTPKASRKQIEHELGVVGYKLVKSKKTGQFKRGTFISKRTRAQNIIAGSRKKRGEKPLESRELKKQARKLIAGRLKAVGSLKRGWTHGIRTFSRAARVYPRLEKGTIKARSAGYPAGFGRFNPKAKFVYKLTVSRNGRRQLDQRVINAATQSLRVETREMGREVAKRLSKDWNKRQYFKGIR